MQRFQLDRAIMVKRWRVEWNVHGRDFGKCHCGLGMGTMRKHRPYESHPSSSCSFCELIRLDKRKKRRQQRYAAKWQISILILESASSARASPCSSHPAHHG